MIRRRLRAVVNRIVGSERRVVRVRSGAARGARLALDLSREKAYWLGYYEPSVQRFLEQNVAPGDVVYDVGAHIGFFSVCAARLGAVVYAFEPVPVNAARLRDNVSLNDFEIHVVEAAAWESSGSVGLVAGDSDFEARATAGTGTPSVSLDEFAEREPEPSLIKLDVEGAEAYVLRGARRLLASARPVLVCEIHGEDTRDDVEELLAGYSLEELEGPTRIVARPAVVG
ncbi:MAG TPA: FkbM family methyltransferase [Gaiellaceae bacterium]|nr:FkbM family methyltransferase [Gaiellaceae bacterium]